jgi:hypothetical protein
MIPMRTEQNTTWTIVQKFDVLCRLFAGQDMSPLYAARPLQDILQIREFLYEKVIELGIKKQGNAFSQIDLNKKMQFLTTYQIENGCEESILVCNGIDCFDSHPECSMKRLILETDALCQLAREYLHL